MDIRFALTLPLEPTSVGRGRQAVEEHLHDVLGAEQLEDVKLVVSELLTNSILHGEGQVELRMQFDGESIKGEVIDRGRGFEHEIREEGIGEIGGQGLRVVQRLATSWGVHEGTTHVWFVIACAERSSRPEPPQLGHPGDEQLPD